MRKTNSVLLLGVVLSFMCSFFLGNIFLGAIIFLAFLGFVMYKQRAAFFASSAASAYKKGDIEKSFTLYEKAIQLEGCPNMVKILYAYRLMSEGKVDQGVKILGTISYDSMNENERLNYNATKALSIWKQGGLHRAIEIYEALLNDKESVLIYETLGYLLICAKNYKKALEFNTAAFEKYNTNERIKCNLATSYYGAGYEKEAVKLYKELIADYAGFPEPYYYYGLILQGREKYKGAVKYFRQALEQKFSYIYTLTEETVQCKLEEVEAYLEDGETE